MNLTTHFITIFEADNLNAKTTLRTAAQEAEQAAGRLRMR